MSIGLLFWLIFVLGFLFSGYWGYQRPGPERFGYFGTSGLVLVLIFLLGWRVFGFVIQN